MANYVLSRKADSDIQAIAEFSVQQWGIDRAEQYLLRLHETFRMLAEFPELGRDASELRAGYRRMETASHSVFYRSTEQGVLIVRVLHQQMDIVRHL